MTKFFSNFPVVEYNVNNQIYKMRNLLFRIKMDDTVFIKKTVYYPYVIEDWERPDTIAADYYGSSNYFWVVLFSNMIIDPYFQWPLNENEFNEYIKKKYNMSVYETMQTIKHFKYTGIGGESKEQIERKNWIMPIETFQNLTAEEKSGWTAVYVYDWEKNENEKKRHIRLLDKYYLPQAIEEFEEITKNVK